VRRPATRDLRRGEDATPAPRRQEDVALDRLPADTTPKGAIERLHGKVRDPLLAGLIHDGALRREEPTFLGVPRSPR
jgi:hypothetical protein